MVKVSSLCSECLVCGMCFSIEQESFEAAALCFGVFKAGDHPRAVLLSGL